jgi:hypothetical protein
MARICSSNVEVTDYVPFPPDKVEVLEGEFREMIHVIRDGAAGEGQLEVGVSLTEVPSKVRYTFEGDHTVYIVFGAIDVELDDGESVSLRAGDIGSFPKDVTCTWHILEPTKEIYVMSG